MDGWMRTSQMQQQATTIDFLARRSSQIPKLFTHFAWPNGLPPRVRPTLMRLTSSCKRYGHSPAGRCKRVGEQLDRMQAGYSWLAVLSRCHWPISIKYDDLWINWGDPCLVFLSEIVDEYHQISSNTDQLSCARHSPPVNGLLQSLSPLWPRTPSGSDR